MPVNKEEHKIFKIHSLQVLNSRFQRFSLIISYCMFHTKSLHLRQFISKKNAMPAMSCFLSWCMLAHINRHKNSLSLHYCKSNKKSNAMTIHICHTYKTSLQLSAVHNRPLLHFGLLCTFSLHNCTNSSFFINP